MRAEYVVYRHETLSEPKCQKYVIGLSAWDVMYKFTTLQMFNTGEFAERF